MRSKIFHSKVALIPISLSDMPILAGVAEAVHLRKGRRTPEGMCLEGDWVTYSAGRAW